MPPNDGIRITIGISDAPPRPFPVLRHVADHLVERRVGEAVELHLGDRPPSRERQTHGGAQRSPASAIGVSNTRARAELLLQPLGHPEDAAELADVLARIRGRADPRRGRRGARRSAPPTWSPQPSPSTSVALPQERPGRVRERPVEHPLHRRRFGRDHVRPDARHLGLGLRRHTPRRTRRRRARSRADQSGTARSGRARATAAPRPRRGSGRRRRRSCADRPGTSSPRSTSVRRRRGPAPPRPS